MKKTVYDKIRDLRGTLGLYSLYHINRLCNPIVYTQGEVTSQNLWSQNDRHFVGMT